MNADKNFSFFVFAYPCSSAFIRGHYSSYRCFSVTSATSRDSGLPVELTM
jgi:hypothetical protein